MATTVTLIPGDGITRELAAPVVSVLEAAGADITFETHHAGADCYVKNVGCVPDATVNAIQTHKVALKGKLLPTDAGTENPNAELRRKLGLFAGVRPIRNIQGLPARHQDIDIALIRETTEDIYAGLEHQIREGIVASLKVVTQASCERISRFAFDYARRHGRKKVSLIHKANIMKITDGLFIKTADKVAAEYPEITYNKLIVDNACMQLLLWPRQFDVLLMGNLYGDIMSDLGAGIVGGIAATMGALVNHDLAVFEAIHGDAPGIVGKDLANPLPFLMPAVYMLEYLDKQEPADRIKAAIRTTLASGTVTPDLGGSASTTQMTQAIIDSL